MSDRTAILIIYGIGEQMPSINAILASSKPWNRRPLN